MFSHSHSDEINLSSKSMDTNAFSGKQTSVIYERLTQLEYSLSFTPYFVVKRDSYYINSCVT